MITEEQRLLRKNGIGGSDAAAIMGLSPWKTTRELWFEKLPNYESVKNEVTLSMSLGNTLEPFLIKQYEEATGHSAAMPTQTFRHKDYPFLIAHIDGIDTISETLIEAKVCLSPAFSKKWGTEGTNQIPPEYLMQCVHYCLVLDKPAVEIIALVLGELKFYRYVRNHELEQQYLQKALEFWYMVQNEIMPPATDCKEHLDDKTAIGEVKVADSELLAKIEKIKAIRDLIKQHEKIEEELKLEILKDMGNAPTLQDSEGKKLGQVIVSNRKSLNLDALKEVVSNLNDYYETKESKSFRIF